MIHDEVPGVMGFEISVHAHNVRMPEEVRGLEGEPCLSRSRHDLNADDGVDTDLEEVVMDADTAPSQQVGSDSG